VRALSKMAGSARADPSKIFGPLELLELRINHSPSFVGVLQSRQSQKVSIIPMSFEQMRIS